MISKQLIQWTACVRWLMFLTAGSHADESGRLDKQELINLVLMCALHGHDPAIDAPWASPEGSTVSLGILSCLAQALWPTSKGMTLAQRQSPSM